MSILDFFINKAISSGFLKSRIQAGARLALTAGATYLVTKGLADQSVANTIVGSGMAVIAAYLQDLDVKIVDGKIKVALLTPVDTSSMLAQPSPQGLTEDQEKKETALLNQLQNIKPGV